MLDDRVEIRFPDAESFAPLRVRARITAEIDAEDLPGEPRAGGRDAAIPVVAHAVAEASPPAAAPARDRAGCRRRRAAAGTRAPLAYRQGKPMRPDVAAAFDRMAAAARAAGISLVINSAFRSDAEQAQLFAQHPDPTWVAPPGQSLHRCATELDLGPSSAYGWLAAHARGFGFLKRYPWEPWHFGYVEGPAPCSAEGDAVGGSAGADGSVGLRRRPPGLRAGEVPRRDPALGGDVERLRRPARGAALRRVELQPLRGLARRRRRASPSSCPGRPPPTASTTRSTPSRRSTPRRT